MNPERRRSHSTCPGLKFVKRELAQSVLQALGRLLYLALERFNLLRQFYELLLCHYARLCNFVRGAVCSVHRCADFLCSLVRGAVCSAHRCTDFLCGPVQLASCHLFLLK